MRFSSAYNIIRKILDAIFPPKDRVVSTRSLQLQDLDRLPAERQPKKRFIWAVCDYRQPNVRQVVKAAKYDGSREAIELMSKLIQEELLSLCDEERIFANKVVITPVPISAHRQREYGFNQSWRLAKAIEKNDTSKTFQAQKLMKKVKKTPTQTSLSKDKRLKNIAGTFRAYRVDAETVIIIDDVTTTGATFTEACRAINDASNVKVLAIAFAH
jgi:ComF family protein